MAIDYSIEYSCFPKQEMTTQGILDRIKGKARAEAVVELFRNNGDNRPVNEIGFEMARSTPNGTEETRVVMVQDLINQAAQLEPFEHYCHGCPANNIGQPFGCFGQIEYPISRKAEAWLLKLMPTVDETLIWLLLRQGLQEMKSDGSSVNAMRSEGQPYFQEHAVLARAIGELSVSSNQLFEMLFVSGHIRPMYAAMLLLIFKCIRRDMEADEVMAVSKSPDDAFERYPFAMAPDSDDDSSIRQFKEFFRALYLAWGLGARLLLDV